MSTYLFGHPVVLKMPDGTELPVPLMQKSLFEDPRVDLDKLCDLITDAEAQGSALRKTPDPPLLAGFAGTHFRGGPGVGWTVELDCSEFGVARVLIGPDYVCRRGGSWNPSNPGEAATAAWEIAMGNVEQMLKNALKRQIAEKSEHQA